MYGRRGWFKTFLSLIAMSALPLGCAEKTTPSGEKGETPAATEQAWKVGAYFSLSGADTQFGVDSKEGIELAIDEVNSAGGVKGKPIKVIFEDDKSRPDEATNKVQQLIDRDKVLAILGEVASSRSRNGGIVANRKKIPMITPSSTNVDVTKTGPYMFRICFTDDTQGQMGAEFIVSSLGKKKIGVLYASDDPYSSGLAKEFSDRAKKLGGEILIEKGFLKSETNFTTYLTEIKNAKPDIIYAPIYYNNMVPIARQAKAAGIPGSMFVGGDGWDSDVLLKDAGEEMEGSYFTNHYAPDVPWPNSQAFVAKYKERFKREPSSLAAQGYDSAKLLADAMGRAKEMTPDAIREAIQNTKNFQGATGTITIDEERNADKPLVIVQIKDKKFRYSTTVNDKSAKPAEGIKPADAAKPTEGTKPADAQPADPKAVDATKPVNGKPVQGQ